MHGPYVYKRPAVASLPALAGVPAFAEIPIFAGTVSGIHALDDVPSVHAVTGCPVAACVPSVSSVADVPNPFISINPSKQFMSSGSWLTLHNCEIFYLFAVNYDPATTDLIFIRVNIYPGPGEGGSQLIS